MARKKILLAQNSAFIANRLPRAAKALKEANYDVDILNWNRGVNSSVIEAATENFKKEGITVYSIYCGNTPYGKRDYYNCEQAIVYNQGDFIFM